MIKDYWTEEEVDGSDEINVRMNTYLEKGMFMSIEDYEEMKKNIVVEKIK